MKLKSKKLVGVVAAAGALLLMLAAVGVSQQGFGPGPGGPPPGGPPPFGGPPPGGPGGHGVLGPVARELNLTDAQKAQIKQIEDSFASSTKELRDQLEALRPNGPEANDGAFDEAPVRAAAQKRAAVIVELEVAHARMMSQVFAVLTPEQKAKLNELRQQFEERRRRWEQERKANQADKP